MKPGQKLCAYCDRSFEPSPHAVRVVNGVRRVTQKACDREKCRKARGRQKLRSWRKRYPERAARWLPKVQAWAKAYPDYWRQYRATHPEYVRRDNERRAKAMRAARRSANETGSAPIVVEKLRAIEALREAECSAKETGLSRRVGAIEEYLLSTSARPCSAKQTMMAAVAVGKG